METKKEKAIALCRVSTDEQLKNNSLNRQNEAVMMTAERHNLEIVRTWSGSASSKSGKNLERKDLKEMMDYCRRNKQIRYVIVDEPDRFMRSVHEAGWYFTELDKLNIKVLFSDEKMNNGDVLSKLLIEVGLITGEMSNEERAKKTKAGHEKAIRDGRYPFVPPLGYMRGKIKGVHEIDPIVGPLLKAQLIRIANGLASPTIALQDYNHSVELAGLKKAPLKMDKWRLICTNPFYCGIIEVHKIVDASNPNGLHQKLITKEQREKIVEAFDGKSKNQKGPNTSGNPLYPFNQMITHVGCPCNKSKYDTFVGVTVKNNQGKEYEKYRCRGCYMYISREEMREKIEAIVASMELTKDGEKALHESLTKVFDLEEGDFESKSIKLRSQRAAAKKEADRLFDCYLAEQPGPMKDSIKCRFEEISRRIKMYDKKIDELGNSDALELRKFCAFAISFVSNLARNILELSPAKMQLCKQLLFPDGFYIDENKNVYTPKISPLYRLKSIKNGSEEPSNSLMVRAKRL
ncbi:recombinase family protein [Candidatus Saccharibacteria bacterium]|nr:recombinase family protein [Candidatus Saccharibacteria bacterium]